MAQKGASQAQIGRFLINCYVKLFLFMAGLEQVHGWFFSAKAHLLFDPIFVEKPGLIGYLYCRINVYCVFDVCPFFIRVDFSIRP